MKIKLAALNAKYSHSSLALRYLVRYCQSQFPEIEALEFNINQDPGLILAELARGGPDIVGFSCYIWNIEMILPLVSNLRRVSPQTTIILGGPEVSFDAPHWLQTHPAIDYLLAGDGEEAFSLFLAAFQESEGMIPPEVLETLPGLSYRAGGQVYSNAPQVLDLASVPYVYQGDLADLENKIVYYETTRGCPYRCAYCLSSLTRGVRRFPRERYQQELTRLAGLGLEQVRFVDRTFNYEPERSYELLEFMIGLDTNTRFQLEVSGDILTEPILELLRTAPPNRFQFEIGVQSTNEATLKAVDRRCDLGRLKEVVQFLLKQTEVRVLLDLIAGLPKEGFWRFGESFDFVFDLKPHRIHLGFLKLLRGSRLRAEAARFGCVYSERAPYEVLQTDDLTFQEIQRLKTIEDLLGKYGGKRFEHTRDYLLRGGQSPFRFFNALAEQWEESGYHWLNHSAVSLYRILGDFFREDNPDLLYWLKYDYRKNEPRRSLPEWMGESNRRMQNELVQTGRILKFLPELAGLAPREIGRRIFVEEFPFAAGKQTILFYFAPEQNSAQTFLLKQS